MATYSSDRRGLAGTGGACREDVGGTVEVLAGTGMACVGTRSDWVWAVGTGV